MIIYKLRNGPWIHNDGVVWNAISQGYAMGMFKGYHYVLYLDTSEYIYYEDYTPRQYLV